LKSFAAPDLAARLECLADRLPRFRAALLAQPAGSLQLTTAHRGDVLLRHGDAAQALYVVADGRLRATVTRADGSELTLSEFGPGEMAGEMAALAGGGVHSASVSVVEEAVLVRISLASFARIAEQSPEAIQELSERIRRRILRDQLAVGLTRLFGHLEEDALRYLEARVEWVRLRAGERLFAEGDTTLDEQEASTQFLVYETDGADSAWTRRCLRQADEVLLVADAVSDAAPGALEAVLLGASAV
jgi:NTE family protein